MLISNEHKVQLRPVEMFDDFDAATWFSIQSYYNLSSGGHEGLYEKYW